MRTAAAANRHRTIVFSLITALAACSPVRYTDDRGAGPEADYLRLVQHHIGQFAPSPQEIKEAGGSGTVVVLFAITRNGDVRRVRVQQSSGDAAVDNLVVKMVYAASPLPPIPPNLPIPPNVQNGDVFTLAMPFKVNHGIF